MKIAHLSTGREWRGGEQQCLYLALGLRERGVEQVILAQPGCPMLKKAEAEGLPVLPFASRGELDLPAMYRLRGILRRENISLIHAHDGHAVTLAGIGGWLAGDVRRVCTRRVDFELKSRWKYRRGMDCVIAISHAIKNICAAGGVPDGKLRVVHSGIEPDRLRGEYQTRKLRESLGLDRRADIILNVAALTDHKGQSYLLEAMLQVATACPRAHLLIAGAGELELDLRAQASELALNEKVHFLGYRQDVGALMELCDLFVMSSHLEGLCTSVLDAMAMERAVVATDAGGLPEVVADGQTGVVVPARDPGGLAGGLVNLLQDDKLRKKMGRAGRQRVLEKFTTRKMVEGNLEIYREICRG